MTDSLGAESERMATVYDLKHATPARYVGRHAARRRRRVTHIVLAATVALAAGMTACGSSPAVTHAPTPVCAHGSVGIAAGSLLRGCRPGPGSRPLDGGFGPGYATAAPGVWL